MCGILGLTSQEFIDSNKVEKNLMLMYHRGPNFQQIKKYNLNGRNTILGHTRLSIIDLSENANQPFTREDFGLSVTYNGEIYNYQEIKDELISHGYSFRTTSDTEVLICGYHFYGIKILERIRGIFAFAIFHTKTNKIFLARDRIGKKPLYYSNCDNKFMFASEIKALLPFLNKKEDIDYSALSDYLSLNYIPSSKTIYGQIKSLDPGHFMIFEHGNIKIQRYWKVSFKKNKVRNLTSTIEDIDKIFSDSVKLRVLSSDVPIGAFLSGGIDSSAVVAYASRYTQSLQTFSIKFDHAAFDESYYAKIIANKFKTKHHEFFVRPQLIDLLPQLAKFYDQPFGDSSALPTYYLCQNVKNHVKVALSGDGGDESFVGYDRYLISYISNIFDRLPNLLKRSIFKTINLSNTVEPKSFSYRLKRLSYILHEPNQFLRYQSVMNCFTQNEIKNLSPDFYHNVFNLKNDYLKTKFFESDSKDVLEQILALDIETYLPEDLLTKVDRASMANSIEVRSPFLDHNLVEYMASVPVALKLKRLNLKYLLKYHLLKGILPHEVMFRQKMGFSLPLHSWFKNDLYDYAYEHIVNGKTKKYFKFNENFLIKLLEDHKKNIVNNTSKIWNLIMLEHWFLNKNSVGI